MSSHAFFLALILLARLFVFVVVIVFVCLFVCLFRWDPD